VNRALGHYFPRESDDHGPRDILETETEKALAGVNESDSLGIVCGKFGSWKMRLDDVETGVMLIDKTIKTEEQVASYLKAAVERWQSYMREAMARQMEAETEERLRVMELEKKVKELTSRGMALEKKLSLLNKESNVVFDQTPQQEVNPATKVQGQSAKQKIPMPSLKSPTPSENKTAPLDKQAEQTAPSRQARRRRNRKNGKPLNVSSPPVINGVGQNVAPQQK
jgi:hypothetical protein